jgi:hypothetical protein
MARSGLFDAESAKSGLFDTEFSPGGLFDVEFIQTGVVTPPPPSTDAFIVGLHRIDNGEIAITAAGLSGVLEE